MLRLSRIMVITIALCTLALVAPSTTLAKGPPIKVDLADPNFAIQAETGTLIKLKGRNFPGNAAVIFILNKPGDPDDGSTTQVVTSSTVFLNLVTGDLEFDIDVLVNAVLGDYDIEVEELSTGRKGRGTTLFKVQQAHGNQEFVNCDVFAPEGTCTCTFHKENRTTYAMQGECQTSETLKVNGEIYDATQNSPNILTVVNCENSNEYGADVPACTGKVGFIGTNVFENATHRSSIKDVTIVFDDRVQRGCNGGEIESAVSNILDGSLPDPRFPDPIQRNSKLEVWRINISSEDDPLCYGIRVIREQSYTDAYSAPDDPLPAREFKIMVGGNEISSGSYVKAGITYLGLMPSEHTNPPSLRLNTIGASSCDEADTALAIHFGNHFPIAPTSDVDEVVEQNTISMENNTCGSSGTGILIIGDQTRQGTTVKANKNVVSGAFFGILVDENVADINFSGNVLTGDGVDGTGDLGICSDAQKTATKGKPNKFSGYEFPEDEIVEGTLLEPCLTP